MLTTFLTESAFFLTITITERRKTKDISSGNSAMTSAISVIKSV